MVCKWCALGVKKYSKRVFLGLKSWTAAVEILWNNEQIALLNRAKCELRASIRCSMKFKRYRISLVFMLFSRWFSLEWKSCLMLFVKITALVLTSTFQIFRFKPKSPIRPKMFPELLFLCCFLPSFIFLTWFATSSKINRAYAQPLRTN